MVASNLERVKIVRKEDEFQKGEDLEMREKG